MNLIKADLTFKRKMMEIQQFFSHKFQSERWSERELRRTDARGSADTIDTCLIYGAAFSAHQHYLTAQIRSGIKYNNAN